MIVKIYWMLWAAVLFVAAALLFTGNLTMMAIVIFGFISFGLVFMGMMSVLPATISHPLPSQDLVSQTAPMRTRRAPRLIEAVHGFMTGLFHSTGVETRTPKYR